MRSVLALLLLTRLAAAEPEFPLTEDSKPQSQVPKGALIKDSYTAKEGGVFPGTQRGYEIYLPAGLDKSKPAAFMVFQDGVIYQAPVVFDNLIANKDIPPLIGIFIKPGIVPAANENALPRFNRSYEYDSITPTYSQFLIDEFLPAIEAKHGIKLSTDPNHAAIAGNSSGGICAFMVAWHRPDRFRRVFTGVGTYVGIHGADQQPVLVRKFEPKPLRVFLQSGASDNNLYCGDWWMANQMMERSLTWAGYDVNHAWGEGGHNQKHASQIFPDVLRWLWRDWQTDIEVKSNPKGESNWKGFEVVGEGEWEGVLHDPATDHFPALRAEMASTADGTVYVHKGAVENVTSFVRLDAHGGKQEVKVHSKGGSSGFKAGPNGCLRLFFAVEHPNKFARIVDVTSNGNVEREIRFGDKENEYDPPCTNHSGVCCDSLGRFYFAGCNDALIGRVDVDGSYHYLHGEKLHSEVLGSSGGSICLSPDQSLLYITGYNSRIDCVQLRMEPPLFQHPQHFYLTEDPYGLPFPARTHAMCVDTNGWLYVATSLGIQVCDQAGRVNFIIPTPGEPRDICFGGKDLGELFVACHDKHYRTHIYKRSTKAKGVVSGQQAPIKPPPPKL
ncbi:alpha/beta hydrolase-fold protein [Prosthecobacter sp.]|uniref:alpha/beta hydrolase-fold protein n=1 Tax=Prosthecobacter sp. TaxID=1965333 RepID=UPI001E0B8BE5|nr:alpha/beta hydrolase-fold protein [Prosthecobacter sp.]MCB1278288.1 SMP-30/gluconolactonase/LRE family protein [Prosthecobacter sp.]